MKEPKIRGYVLTTALSFLTSRKGEQQTRESHPCHLTFSRLEASAQGNRLVCRFYDLPEHAHVSVIASGFVSAALEAIGNTHRQDQIVYLHA